MEELEVNCQKNIHSAPQNEIIINGVENNNVGGLKRNFSSLGENESMMEHSSCMATQQRKVLLIFYKKLFFLVQLQVV